jgi:DNA-binding winged helix-turn-helix (wHTH) protein
VASTCSRGFVSTGTPAFEVLDVLVGQAGDLASRDEFMAAVWPATAVEETNLNMQIAALRRILDEGGANGSCIQTVPGRGYRFAVPVTLVAADTARHSGRAARCRCPISRRWRSCRSRI